MRMIFVRNVLRVLIVTLCAVIILPTGAFAAGTVPVNVSLTPDEQQYVPAIQKFTATTVHNDPDAEAGHQLDRVYLLINSTTTTSDGTDKKLYLRYQRDKHFFLCTTDLLCLDAGEDGGATESTVSNAWVTLYAESAVSKSADGKTWTVTWVFSVFEDQWNEVANAYMRSIDRTGRDTGWQDMADYTVDSIKPTIDTISAEKLLFSGDPKTVEVDVHAVDLLVEATGNDYVELTELNSTTYPTPFRPRFTDIGGNQYLYTNMNIELNKIRNKIIVAAVDTAGNRTEETVYVNLFPIAHVDVRTISEQTGAKIDPQADVFEEAYSSRVNIDTIASIPGAKGLMCSYFRDGFFLQAHVSLLEPIINHANEGAQMAQRAGHDPLETEDYSIRCEGRIRSDQTGNHLFIVNVGRYDNIRLFIDSMDKPMVDFTYAADPADDDPLTESDVTRSALIQTRLERNVWYGFVLEYKGLHEDSDPFDSDFLALRWQQPRCKNMPILDVIDDFTTVGCRSYIDENHLAFSSGGIAEYESPFDVVVTLPRGFQYVAGSAEYFGVDESTGVLLEPEVDPLSIDGINNTQTLTWHVTDVVPVGKSIRLNYDADLYYVYRLY